MEAQPGESTNLVAAVSVVPPTDIFLGLLMKLMVISPLQPSGLSDQFPEHAKDTVSPVLSAADYSDVGRAIGVICRRAVPVIE